MTLTRQHRRRWSACGHLPRSSNGERPILFDFDQLRHDTTSSFQTHRQWCHIQQQEVLDLRRTFSSQDCSLHSSSICHSLIRIDRSVWLLAIEELLDQLLDLGDTSGTPHQYDLMDIALVNATVPKSLLHWTHRVAEIIHVQLFKSGTGERARVVNTIKQVFTTVLALEILHAEV